MNDLRKAAEMALKFCEDIGSLTGPYPYVNETAVVSDSRKILQALRQALAQLEHEPVAWVQPNGKIVVRTDYGGRLYYSEQNVYTAPPKREWVGLTDDEIDTLANDHLVSVQEYIGMGEYISSIDGEAEFAKAIEAKLKEKNT